MKLTLEQDCLINDCYIGPTITRSYKDRKFIVEFPDNPKWLTSDHAKLQILHEKYETVAENSIGVIHERLDQFIKELAVEDAPDGE